MSGPPRTRQFGMADESEERAAPFADVCIGITGCMRRRNPRGTTMGFGGTLRKTEIEAPCTVAACNTTVSLLLPCWRRRSRGIHQHHLLLHPDAFDVRRLLQRHQSAVAVVDRG